VLPKSESEIQKQNSGETESSGREGAFSTPPTETTSIFLHYQRILNGSSDYNGHGSGGRAFSLVTKFSDSDSDSPRKDG
jgi:hypothetical protein